MHNNYYNPNLRKYARELRNETVSRAEKFLWKAVLSRKQTGVKFKRQRPIYNFIVDFFCQEIGLIIEIDGNSHFTKGAYDAYRQEKLQSLGFTVIRFEEGVVLNRIDEVHQEICYVIKNMKTNGACPPP